MQPTTQELIRKIHDARELLMEVCIALNNPTAVAKPKPTPTPPMPKQMKYRGDTGLVRKALWDCGWFKHAEDCIFNDKRKNWSRIKVWFAGKIYAATQAEQEALEQALRKEFGDRILKMGFVPCFHQTQSLCIWLRK